MSTSTAAQKKPAAKAPGQQQEEPKVLFAGMVPIDNIIVDGTNARKTFNTKKDAELTESVRTKGVAQAILLRPNGKPGKYVLVAGERRVRASIAAGKSEIPAIVRDLTAENAPVYRSIENLQRADLSPIEEARDFQTLISAGKYTVAQLAETVDKSESYVYRAVKLLELPQPLVDAIDDGKVAPSFGYLIAACGEKFREKLVKHVLENQPTIDQLKYVIQQTVEKSLSGCAFPTNKPYADRPACTDCPHNSGNQGMLFDGAEKGNCTDPTCFNAKVRQTEKDFVAKAEAQYPGIECIAKAVAGYGEPEEIKGYRVLGQEIHKLPAVKKLMKDNPDAFGLGVLTPARHSDKKTPELYLLARDPGAIEKVLPKGKKIKPTEPQSRGYEPPKPKTERELFIEKAVQEGMQAEADKLAQSFGEEEAVAYFRRSEQHYIREACKELKLNQKKLVAEDVLRVVTVAYMLETSSLNQAIDVYGGDSKKLEAELAKAAGAAFDKKDKDESPAKVKKGGK